MSKRRRGREGGEVDHAWCKGVARDERVRADEDGRAGALPTLAEAIRVVSGEEPGRDMGNGVFVASVSEVHAMYGETIKWLIAERDAAIRERDAIQARVAELEAASGGGEGEVANVTFHADDSAERARYVGMTVKPLRRPLPRGWLTEEERELIAGITDDDEYTEEGQNIAKGLLARSTPPKVKLPECPYEHYDDGWNPWFAAVGAMCKALDAAGVEVKEVGK